MRRDWMKFLLAVSLLAGCQSTGEPDKVELRGALRNIMQQGDLSAKAHLDSLSGMPNLYALGAVAGLKGEIQVFGGQPLVSTVVDSQLALSRSFEHGAALLAYTEVAKWQKVDLLAALRTPADLQAFLQSEIEQQPALHEPLPFLLRGPLSMLKWHVIDWPQGDSEHTHEKHQRSGLHGVLRNQPVEVFGFYSSRHHAVLTHHTTNLHAHFKTAEETLAGHVDSFELSAQTELFLPVR